MAGFTNNTAAAVLDHVLGGSAMSQPAGCFIQLHTADPTETGTVAVAGNATRKSVTWAAATVADPSNKVSSADLDWTTGEVDTTEVYTFYSLWSAVTAGTALGTGTVTGGSVTAGNAFTIASGNLQFDLD